MQLDPKTIAEQLTNLGDDWADKHAAAEMLEETKKSVLAKLAADSLENSMAAKENYALAHEDYTKHVKSMVEARRAANKAKVRYDSGKVWAELMRTQSANERAVMRNT